MFFSTHAAPSIFILAVGANVLSGDWNIGLGELRELRRQTVILWQNPAHPSPSLHLCDLVCCFRNPRLLPPACFLCPLGEKDDASLNLITMSKISPPNQSTWPHIRPATEGTALYESRMALKVKTLGGKAIFHSYPAKQRGKYSWPGFKVDGRERGWAARPDATASTHTHI